MCCDLDSDPDSYRGNLNGNKSKYLLIYFLIQISYRNIAMYYKNRKSIKVPCRSTASGCC